WIGEKVSSSYFGEMRTLISRRILNTLSLREASLLLALMIGDTDLLSDEQQEIYREIGAQHLLAVSGLQVTILAAICFFFLMPAFGLLLPRRFGHRAQALAALTTVLVSFWFIGVAGLPASAVRAFLMACILLLPNFIARSIDPFDSFFASGLVSILFAPECVLDLGYLLSYAAVFGLLMAHLATKAWHERAKKRSLLLAWSMSLVVTSMAAFLATMPIIAHFIGNLSPLAALANLVLVPVASVLQALAIIFGLLGALFDWSGLIGFAAYFSNAIEILADALKDSLGKIVYLPDLPPTFFITAIIASLFFSCFLATKKRVHLIFACLPFLWLMVMWCVRDEVLEVTVLPIGQGDATLLSLPKGPKILIDAGGNVRQDFDPGERIAVPSLKRRGITKLDILIITHPDPDHILGAFAVLNHFAVNEIWHSGFSPEHPLTKRLIDEAERHNVQIKNIKDILGSHRWGNTELQVLAPDTGTDELYFSELSANNNSLVIRIVHGDYALLWPGDLERLGEELLLSSNKNLQATVLKAPHHGSKTSSSDAFIAAVRPTHVIYSTGPNNRFHFPHQEIVDKLEDLGIYQWNTAEDGEITIKIAAKELSVSSFVVSRHASLKKRT
ncbi:MAG TPA: DNA internalization-related competence protein ComEC/Rec2, partial [Myxococcota bacterium]|nr:DNA internalization-related competence protein ComEC/Rec2 [Myxococcota bacterium]